MMGSNRRTLAKARWGLTLGSLLLSSAAWAQARIESVTGTLQSGSEVIRVELSEPLAADPTGFVVQTPARIALDFPGVTNGSGKSLLEFNQGNLRSANLVEASGRSRQTQLWAMGRTAFPPPSPMRRATLARTHPILT